MMGDLKRKAPILWAFCADDIVLRWYAEDDSPRTTRLEVEFDSDDPHAFHVMSGPQPSQDDLDELAEEYYAYFHDQATRYMVDRESELHVLGERDAA